MASRPSPSAAPTSSIPRFVPDQLIVRFKSGTSGTERASTRKRQKAKEIRRLLVPRIHLVELAEGGSVSAAARAFELDPNVEYAEPNYIRELTSTVPNDSLFDQLWGLHNAGQTVNGVPGTVDADIDAPEAWDTTKGSAAVTVGVIDSGVAYNHPDLLANIWSNPGETGAGKETNGSDDDGNGLVDDFRGYDFQDHDNNPIDEVGHGSHVAGTIGAVGNNGSGVAGVNWNVRVAPLRACYPNAFFSGSCPDAGVVDAFAYAGEKGFRVVNGSFGGPAASPPQAYVDAIAGAPDTMFVFAAGNETNNNDASPRYPCNLNLPNVLCVAATDQNDGLASSFSNYGSTTVDLGAPGTSIQSTEPKNYPLRDRFNTNDFSTRWTIGGTNPIWGQTQGCDAGGCLPVMEGQASPFGSTDSWARTATSSSLAGLAQCRLQYMIKPNLQTGTLQVQASTNAVNWTTVRTWSTSTGSFQPAEDNLSAFDGQPSVYIRFRFTLSGGSFAYVDIALLGIRCIRQTYTGTEYEFSDGTSMASPHVAGAAALLWARNPTVTVARVRDALLSSVDAKASLSGKTVTGGRLNLAGAVSRIEPFDHPTDASPLRFSLVPDFRQTISASQCLARGGQNSAHGAPLSYTSCQPPAYLPGTAAKMGSAGSGSAQLTVVPGNPSTPVDEADVTVALNLADVRSVATGGDYLPNGGGPDVSVLQKLRVSDTGNGSAGDAGGTTTDFEFRVPVNCAATTSTTVGSNCLTTTTADAVTPGMIKERKSMVLQVFRVRVTDSGTNGTPGNADDRSFAQQGEYVR